MGRVWFFIPNSSVFSCWSQKTSKWVENITQTHSHSILIGPPTPTWFPFVVSLQARILFASKLISQKLLSFILTTFYQSYFIEHITPQNKTSAGAIKKIFPTINVSLEIDYKRSQNGSRVSAWHTRLSFNGLRTPTWFPVSDSHLSGNALAFQWLTSQERDSVLFLRDSRVIFASAEESSAWNIWPLNSRYVSSAIDHGRADVHVFLVVAFFSSFSAMNAFTFVCDHSLKLSVITNSMFVVLYLNSGLIINVWLILRSSSAYTKGVRHLMIVFLFSTTSVHGVPF